MRKYQNLNVLFKHNSDTNNSEIANLLIEDLKQACCVIFGETIDEQTVLLAKLMIQADSLHLHSRLFHHRIEFIVEGKIVNDQYPALTYTVNGATFQFQGRCSTIPQICGVDLYLDKSYTEKVGDRVQQKFNISFSKLFKSVT